MSLPASIVLGIHIFSAAVLLSAAYQALFAKRLALLPKNAVLAFTAILVTTGFNNFLQRVGTGIPKPYHMWFGIKFLLALHVIAMLLICTTGSSKTPEKQQRLLAGAGISSLFVILISVYLNYLATH